jgi:hypothetical protein
MKINKNYLVFSDSLCSVIFLKVGEYFDTILGVVGVTLIT